jgi:hypothetical protein
MMACGQVHYPGHHGRMAVLMGASGFAGGNCMGPDVIGMG